MHGHHTQNYVSSHIALALSQTSITVSIRNQIREHFYMNTNTDIDKTLFEQELAQHIVTALNLEISPAEIDPLAPLYGDEGLGIDSIDVLEISLVLTKQYGVQLRSDDENNAKIFASLRNLANHIQQNRTK